MTLGMLLAHAKIPFSYVSPSYYSAANTGKALFPGDSVHAASIFWRAKEYNIVETHSTLHIGLRAKKQSEIQLMLCLHYHFHLHQEPAFELNVPVHALVHTTEKAWRTWGGFFLDDTNPENVHNQHTPSARLQKTRLEVVCSESHRCAQCGCWVLGTSSSTLQILSCSSLMQTQSGDSYTLHTVPQAVRWPHYIVY